MSTTGIERKYDVVIIGSGLAGLVCGSILSKEGKKVCIIEKNAALRINFLMLSFIRSNIVRFPIYFCYQPD